MNLPNVLTLSRIGFAFAIAAFLSANTLNGNIIAAVLFTVAALTDFYDGHLAKSRGLTSNFGKIMDPIADKVLMLSVFAVLAHIGMVAWWMVIAIAAREIAVTVSRLHAMSLGEVLAAETAGKIKTVCQMVTVSLALLFLIAEQTTATAGWFYRYEEAWRALINIFMVASVFLTVFSGFAYFKNKYRF